MVKKIFTNSYVIAGIIIFLLLAGILYFGAQLTGGESLFGAVAISAVGVASWWWKENIW